MKIIFLLTFFLFPFVTNVHGQVAVISNKSVQENAINIELLENIYSAKIKYWKDGTKIMRYIPKSNAASWGKFLEAIGRSSTDMMKLWMKLQLTGEGQAPETTNSDEAILNKVSSIPGAIGFINAKKISNKVKVLLILN